MNPSSILFFKFQSPLVNVGMTGVQEQFIGHPLHYLFVLCYFCSTDPVICFKPNRIEGEWNGREN